MKRTSKIGIIAIAGVLCGIGVALWHRANPLVARLPDGRWVWSTGLLLNPNSSIAGKPARTEASFKRLYQAIVAFRDANQRLPYAPQELERFAKDHSSKVSLAPDDLTSQDVRLSDEYSHGVRDHLGYVFDLRGPRPNGQDKPAFPKLGEKDAWVSTTVYLRDNARVYPDMSVKAKPSGFYIVLWSDGDIERIPAGKLMWVSNAGGLEGHYPGQTGIPRNAIPNEKLGARFSGAVPSNVPGGPSH